MIPNSRNGSLVSTLSRLMIFLIILCARWRTHLVEAAQQLPPNFLNQTGCLYATTADSGQYRVDFYDGTESQMGSLGKLSYGSDAKCITDTEPGKLVMNFDISDDKFVGMTIDLELKNNMKTFNWDISKATLTIKPQENSQLFPEKVLDIKPANGGEIYAGVDQSYSCSSLIFTNSAKNGPVFKITLRRFQLQPFHEPETRIFAPSRDCASWLTLPQIMGFLLILFMTFTVLMGVYLLIELGGHSSDLRFSKQGGMLMNQAQLDATKGE